MIRAPLHTPNHKQLQTGFTLLEMLLVIVMVAILLVMVGQHYRNQTTELQVDKTAVEMQALLQAAQGYYLNSPTDAWPKDINALTAAPYQLKACGNFFLSRQHAACGKNNNYTLHFPSGYGSGQDSQPQAGGVIITTQAPNRQVADKLAAKLPSSFVNTSTNEVSVVAPTPNDTTSISLPSLMNAEKMVMIKSIYSDLIGKNQGNNLSGNMSGNHFATVQLPSCPRGWTPGYDVALNQFIINKGSIDAWATDYVALCKKQYTFSPNATGTTQFTVMEKRSLTGDSWHSASVLVATYCIPPSLLTDDSGKNTDARNYLDKFVFKGMPNPNKADDCYFANFRNTNG